MTKERDMMTEPATDDDGYFPMTLKDWLEIIDEAVDDLVEKAGSDLKRLVAFLRAKADEIAAIEPLEDFGDPEEECEQDEETEE